MSESKKDRRERGRERQREREGGRERERRYRLGNWKYGISVRPFL